MDKYLPNGVLGIALTGLLAAFMAGMAANVSSFNTVFTYDIWQTYIVKDRRDGYYLRVGRIVTVVGILIGIGTAFIAAGYNNIMNYIQLLFSLFNAPLFATFIIAMFWKRTTPWAGVCGLGGRHDRRRRSCTSRPTTSATSIPAGGRVARRRSTRRWPTSTARSPRSSPTPW